MEIHFIYLVENLWFDIYDAWGYLIGRRHILINSTQNLVPRVIIRNNMK